MIKAVFLDIDNTLLDFDGYVKHTMLTGFEHFGLKSYEPWMFDVFTEENNKLWRAIEDGVLTLPELQKIRWQKIFGALDIEADGIAFEGYFRKQLFTSAIEIPGALKLLQDLHSRGFILCASSNGPYEQQLNRLSLAGMKDYFSYFFISEKLGCSKPAAEFAEAAFRELNVGRTEPVFPVECVVIGDSMTSDMALGFVSDMKTCFYRAHKNTVPDGRLTWVVDDLSEIPALF